MIDLSIIVASNRPHTLSHVMRYIHTQSADGIDYETVVVQEADNFDEFVNISYGLKTRIFRQAPHHDCGAAAKDRGLAEAQGKYVVFWDDDNIYYPHAITALFSAATGHDLAISKIRRKGTVIPMGKMIRAGDIDTMCLCARRELAAKIKWADGGGRYSDFRWVGRLARICEKVNYSPVIIGEHL
jgi:glycosyltransferase involved in cell wall biosynthesis